MTTSTLSLARKCRWVRFSLRGLLLTTTLLSMWLGWHSYRAAEQQAVVAYLRSLQFGPTGCEVRISYDNRNTLVWIPSSWQIAIGEDYFRNVDEVCLTDSVSSSNIAEVVAQLKRLPSLRKLMLRDVSARGDKLSQLTRLTQINALSIQMQWQPQLVKADFEYLERLTKWPKKGDSHRFAPSTAQKGDSPRPFC